MPMHYHNMTASQLADELGRVKAEIAPLQRREKEIKDALLNLGLEEIDGELFRVTVTSSIRETLDSAQLRKLLTERQLRDATRVSRVNTVRCTALRTS